MKEVTDKTEFIIGIDYGHGETSAAFYDLKAPSSKQDVTGDIDILPGKPVVKSAVAILEQEGQQVICIGDEAIANAPMAKDFQISFKKRPSEMNEIERKRMIAFMKGVYIEILDRHPDYKTREHVVYIARPSQDSLWKSEENDYLALAEKAGIPVAGIQKESRAAYFRARTKPNSKIDTQVKKGVLIVDFGSSTIDFTYLNGTLTTPIDGGYELGANEVEKTLMEYAMAHPNSSDKGMQEFVKRYGKNKESNPYNQMLYLFRKAKEEFYGGKKSMFSVSFDYSLLTSSETSPIFEFGGIHFTRELVNAILGKGPQGEYIEGGYIKRVHDAVKAFKNDKLKNNAVACVYLTGGASRMDFVREIFMSVFGLDDAHCPSDDNPSTIVSQGVAHLSYADIVTANKGEELREKINNLISEFPWTSTITSIIKEAVKEEIKSSAFRIMIKWRDGEIYETQPNSTTKLHNLKSLKKTFDNLFISFNGLDFITKCSSVINDKLGETILSEIKKSFMQYQFVFTDDFDINISGLRATLSPRGIEAISQKFTGNGYGHIIYDSIASRNIFMKDQLNMEIERLDGGRKKHYEQYPYSIYSDKEWENFFSSFLTIHGIEEAKVDAKSYAEELLQQFVSYAKLAIFFK